ncbi:hypothetical protein J7E50_22310 [Pedobacter sp. ISL-68]|uniref:hypothetical protein n=1 Tax=unclassified Pedobacter TaxID=2628915 RepID=UPI001BECCDA2|nr:MULTISPECIES: hypothetical protein [unclassified Pedobacter]MBT2562966.1 hypothetical protein [Pedobacter sp. ISL-64]MBT2592970.1 hypothetical protein [Pedobacter sp. ISL-68]
MKYLLICFCLLLFIDASAQQDTLRQKRKTYFGVGFSLGGGGNRRLYGDVDFFLQKRNSYISFKTSGVERIRIFYFGGLPEPRISDVGILVGKSYTFNHYHYLKFGVGVALVHQVSRGALLYNDCDRPGGCLFSNNIYETIRKKPIGLPLEIKYGLYLDRTAAVTAGFSANLNDVESFYGISVGLVVGRLKDKVSSRY